MKSFAYESSNNQSDPKFSVIMQDKAYEKFEAAYKAVCGGKSVPPFEDMLNELAELLHDRRKYIYKGCNYLASVYTCNEGYGKSSTFKREVVQIRVKVTLTKTREAKVTDITPARVNLYPGEWRGNCLRTDGAKTRMKSINKFLGLATECPLTIVTNMTDAKKDWEAVCERMYDFAV